MKPLPYGYLLVNRTPVPCQGSLEWMKGMALVKPLVAHTVIGPARVSTRFLGLDFGRARLGDDVPPLTFETMLFWERPDVEEQEFEQYATWAEAEAGHHRWVERVRKAQAIRA